MTENDIGKIIVNEAIHLHRALGPGLLETVYEVTLARPLRKAGLQVARQVPIPIEFEGDRFDEGFRCDLLVEETVMIELKPVEALHLAHKKQLLTYLKLTGHKLGYLLNFGDELMKNGIVRIINGTLDTTNQEILTKAPRHGGEKDNGPQSTA